MNKPIPTLAILALLPILALLALAVACGAPAATAPTPPAATAPRPPAATAPRPTLVPQVSPLPQGDRLATREALRAAGAASATAMARRTPVPTSTLATEPVATPTATPQPGIGVTREKIENRFRRVGLEFEGRRLADGRYSSAILDRSSLIVELVGPSKNLTSAFMAYVPSGREAAFNVAASLAFLEETFPEWPEAIDWVSSALGEMNGDGERSTTRGNKVLTVGDNLGLILITVEAK